MLNGKRTKYKCTLTEVNKTKTISVNLHTESKSFDNPHSEYNPIRYF